MRARDLGKLWAAKVRVEQPGYVGYVDAQVWAPNAAVARRIFKQQYRIEDYQIISVREVRL